MAKTLKKQFPGIDSIEQGQTINSWHVSQSVDAFTGEEEYNITISGSLFIQGSGSGNILYVDGDNFAEITGSNQFLVRDTDGRIGFKDANNGAAGTSGTSGTGGLNGISGSSGTSGTAGTSGTGGTSGVSGTSGTSGTSSGGGVEGFTRGLETIVMSSGNDLYSSYTLHTDNRPATGSGELVVSGTNPSNVTVIKANIGSNGVVLNNQLANAGSVRLRNQAGSATLYSIDSVSSGSGVLTMNVTLTSAGANFVDGAAAQEFRLTSGYFLLPLSRSYTAFTIDNQTPTGFKTIITYQTVSSSYSPGDTAVAETFISKSNVDIEFRCATQAGLGDTFTMETLTSGVPEFKTHVTKLMHWQASTLKYGAINLGTAQVN